MPVQIPISKDSVTCSGPVAARFAAHTRTTHYLKSQSRRSEFSSPVARLLESVKQEIPMRPSNPRF